MDIEILSKIEGTRGAFYDKIRNGIFYINWDDNSNVYFFDLRLLNSYPVYKKQHSDHHIHSFGVLANYLYVSEHFSSGKSDCKSYVHKLSIKKNFSGSLNCKSNIKTLLPENIYIYRFIYGGEDLLGLFPRNMLNSTSYGYFTISDKNITLSTEDYELTENFTSEETWYSVRNNQLSNFRSREVFLKIDIFSKIFIVEKSEFDNWYFIYGKFTKNFESTIPDVKLKEHHAWSESTAIPILVNSETLDTIFINKLHLSAARFVDDGKIILVRGHPYDDPEGYDQISVYDYRKNEFIFEKGLRNEWLSGGIRQIIPCNFNFILLGSSGSNLIKFINLTTAST